MRIVLINPNWNFSNSVYFGCREPHLPLEFGYASTLLNREGHETCLIDAQFDDLSYSEVFNQVKDFCPDFSVITTAPSYLFWRCPPPELREPQELITSIREVAGKIVVVGPHGSATPETVKRKTSADLIIVGEFEDSLRYLEDPGHNPCIYTGPGSGVIPGVADVKKLPALHWAANRMQRHHHHHHRFDQNSTRPGSELESSRGCPYSCVFCAKEFFRTKYRKRPLPIVLEELDNLLNQGVEYVYFIDETFMPDPQLLVELRNRRMKFGIQTRIDLWTPTLLRLLGDSGCVSIEAGLDSITDAGRMALDKKSSLTTDEYTERLCYAKQYVPFVQANLILNEYDTVESISVWRDRLIVNGVWANDPIPLYPYPGSPLYRNLFGAPDNYAWERAHDYYLSKFTSFSELQTKTPKKLSELELETVDDR